MNAFSTALCLTLLAAATPAALAQAADTEKLPSGVTVEHLQRGQGEQPTPSSTVRVHYRGTLAATGAEFDSSYKRGQPATFPLNRVIPCWTEGVARLKVGGKARLTCPPATAYGPQGAGPIPPNSTLVFEVELLSVGGR